ncbi:prepilin-type N-terminal cleavage/methylation domain-containing protein [Aromatoleum aromaticum]|uniref:prepilin-type N-terminal cleavage/methylation domain-containing protein n=1 Tax=Aromatoleum aromaticum TaxID=551760 RepID=UPI001459A0F0|nr:prepilin-type N-terminal cleavage/methylation domain-containing protein [Aromatoleum aromaticum]NMG53970.1 prepilin-type N-terminal cleavage/methylation domain-containing protein [Aromatoleum aromaticum]
MKRQRATRGFTLVEIIIALSLLSLIMLALVAALRTFGESGSRLEARSERADDMRLVSGFLRRIVSEASVAHPRKLDDGTEVPDFLGEPQALEWLAPMPARHGVGGLHWLRLSVRSEAEGFDLALQWVPFVPPLQAFAADPDARPDWEDESARVLVRRLDSFSVAYQRLGRSDWQDNWSDAAVLPGRVAFKLRIGGASWPDLIVPVLAAEPGLDVNATALDRAQ